MRLIAETLFIIGGPGNYGTENRTPIRNSLNNVFDLTTLFMLFKKDVAFTTPLEKRIFDY